MGSASEPIEVSSAWFIRAQDVIPTCAEMSDHVHLDPNSAICASLGYCRVALHERETGTRTNGWRITNADSNFPSYASMRGISYRG